MKWPKPLSKLSKGFTLGEGRRSASWLVLGTAQLGMAYGIANRSGKPDSKTALSIVQTAFEGGVVEFDTAQAYGESEKVLGEVLYRLAIAGKVRIISKLNPTLNHLNKELLSLNLEQSLSRLKIATLHCLMLHREEFIDLLDSGLRDILLGFVRDGRVKHIGVSLYSTEKAIRALNTDIIDIVQVPANIIDRRFNNAGVFDLARQRNKKVYVRSVFLQGLLLMDTEDLPAGMDYVKPMIGAFNRLGEEVNMTKQEMALGYVKSKFPDASIVFGAETSEQVRANLSSWATEPSPAFLTRAGEEFEDTDEHIIDPTLWPG